MSPKRTLRQNTRSKRDAICIDERHRMARAIRDRLFFQDEYRNAGAVLFYAAFGSEVPTIEMMETGLKAGKTIVLPITDTKTNGLVLRKISDLSTLVENKYGIPEPAIDNTESFDKNDIDLIIVPGIVFDEDGWRIGYGGGYYDRFLRQIEKNVPWISVAFEIQIVPRIPAESHDMPVDKIVTEKRVIDARGSRSLRQSGFTE